MNTKSAAEAWAVKLGDSKNVTISESFYTNYYVGISPEWYQNVWKPERDSRNAITAFYSCNSATGADKSVISNAGGRVGFGYSDCPEEWKIERDGKRLFGRMSGRSDSGKRRPAMLAYDNGNGYTPIFKNVGNLWTTLCPAPIDMFPKGDQDRRTGWGCFIYDTYMEIVTSGGKDVITVTKEKGTAIIKNFRWVGNAVGRFCVGFDFNLLRGGSAQMKVSSDESRSKATDATLSKDDVKNRTHDGNGVAPNGDDGQWEFQAR